MGKLFVKGRVIDGTGRPPFQGTVVIDDDKIEQVAPDGAVQIPCDATVIDAGSGTILPGLIDAHLHLMGVRSMNPLMWVVEPLPVRVARAVRDCADLLNAGFTSVRDAGGLGVYLKRVIGEGEIPGPRIVSPNKVLSQTGGHGDVHFLPMDFVQQHGFSRICDGVDECRKAAREQFREGADYIKICTTGGVMSEKDKPGSSQFTVEEVAAIVEEARRVGAFVASHAQGTEGINTALRAGVKTIEHGFYINEESIELMLKNDCIMVPTLAIAHRIVTVGEKFGVPEYGIRKAREAHKAHREAVQRAKAAGVKVAMGTDFTGGPMLPFGENAMELELFVELGFTPMEAIVSATKIGAQAIGMGDKLGTLEAGKLADLIVVNGDPLADISCLKNPNNVRVVVKGGKVQKHLL
ncbi:MAG: amidohydrolase family protein [Bacillota bacterium]